MKDFKRFKKKVLIEHAIKSVLVGLGVGLTAAALAILLSYLTNPQLALGLSVTIGLLSAIGSGLLMWYKAMPSDKKIALRLDAKLGLCEKISTMIEFQGKDSAMYAMQRDDAEVRLAEKPTKSLAFTLSIWAIPALAISAAFFAGSFFVPKNPNHIDSIGVTSTNTFDGITDSGIDSFKKDMEDFEADEAFKSALQSILDDLLEDLKGDSDIQSRYEKVESAKTEVDIALDNANTNEEIGKALMTEEDQNIKSFGAGLAYFDIQAARDALQNMYNELSRLSGQELADKAHSLAAQFRDALAKAEAAGVDPADSLYQAVKAIADSLDKISSDASTTTMNNVQDDFQSVAEDVTKIVGTQEKNEELAIAVKEFMDTLVDPSSPDDPNNPTETDPDDDDPTDPSNPAGPSNTDPKDNPSNPGEPSDTTTSDPGEPSDTTTSDPGDDSNPTDISNPGDGSDPTSDPTQNPNPGSNPGSEPGNGSNPGGQGSTSDHPTDSIYTADGQTEYGSVINSYQGGFVDDHRDNGDEDPEAGDAAEDYFNGLYGSEGGK
ncbi:MAG: hypothetical protein MJ228_05165 [Bacilli bacterium]|nr:hypothetical protein [Bacilli bacterium]